MKPFSFASAISVGRKPARSVVLCAMLAIRTTEERTPRSARPITARSTSLRTRRVPLYSSPPGRAGSSSVAGRPRFPGEPMLPAATSGFPVPSRASPYASMIGSSAAVTASSPPEGSRSCRCATWMTPSESAAASLSPSRSSRLPRRTFAPSADSAAAAVSDRARPVTSCPEAMSSGMMYEPEWPVPPVTKKRKVLLLVNDVAREMVVRVRSAENADAESDVESPRAVAGQAHQQRPCAFQPAGHLQAADIERTQSEALDERRHSGLGRRVISGEEHVQRAPQGQDMAEYGVERLHDVRALGGGLGDLLRSGRAIRSDQPGGVGVEGVGDVDDDLPGQRIPVLGDDLYSAGVRHGEDDEVTGRGGAKGPGRGAAAERRGHFLGFDRIAADDLDGVPTGERPGGQRAGHIPETDNAHVTHMYVCFLALGLAIKPRRRILVPNSVRPH